MDFFPIDAYSTVFRSSPKNVLGSSNNIFLLAAFALRSKQPVFSLTQQVKFIQNHWNEGNALDFKRLANLVYYDKSRKLLEK